MDAFTAWVLVPLALVSVSLGVGLLVERVVAAGLGELTVPVGFAASLVLLSVPYSLGISAPGATLAIALVALAGLALGRARLRGAWPGAPLALAAAGAYVLYLAPVLLSGSATFTGYGFLGDNAVHFSLVDHVREHGSRMVDLPFSSYGTVLHLNLGNGYPLGPHFQLASLTSGLGTEVAWLYQPYLAAVAALAALPGARLLRALGVGAWPAAVGGFVAASAYLPFAYGLQGGAKELIMILLVLLGAVFAAELGSGERTVRSAVLVGIIGAAAFTTYSAGGLPWIAAMAGAGLVLAVLQSPDPRRTAAVAGGALAAVFAVGALASLGSAVDFFEPARRLLGSESDAGEGNLVNGLPPSEAFGIWLAGDFRFGPDQRLVTYALVAGAATLAVAGAVYAYRARAVGLLLAAGSALLVWAVLPAGIWIEAKLLVVLSPCLVLLAVAGASALARTAGQPLLGIAVGGLLALAVLASDGMAYRDAYVAPRDRLEELRRIGERFAGEGPALFAEFEEYGKHFLREMDPIAAFDGYALLPAELREGGGSYGSWADLDEMTLAYVRQFPLIVRRRNPVASRPPAPYRRVHVGGDYEVWRVEDGGPEVVDHLPLGDDGDPTGPVDCAAVRELAGREDGVELVVAERPVPIRIAAIDMQRPPAWPPLKDGGVGGRTAGTLSGEAAAKPGRYRVWVRGTFGRGVDVLVDGRSIGRAEEIQTPEQMALAGEAALGGDSHTIELVRAGPGFSPGNGRDEGYESIFLEPVGEPALRRVPLARADSLCGRRADWVELVDG